MTQNPLNGVRPQTDRVRAAQRTGGLLRCSYIGFRFMRYRFWPWLTLAIAPFNLLGSSGGQRIHAQIRYLRALSRIDFVPVYGLLDDLLW